ncbi:ArnT family glycosyltransferase [Rhizosaccharibacter radicis]|uniref:Glycosyltransferase family 39 protein n=1 Tax=Rhizosaccharibacter radicis TaxID=2782605 RepID=A0ABT1W075_9PROT|nr:glycosyltransferase family 39 protein [Acetobacteraceae bacterium KSS12]
MVLSVRHYLFIAITVLALFLPGRATLPPLDRDEPRYMEASAQMLRSGDWVDVRFQDKPRYLQPAGIYWLEAASVALTGTLEKREVWAYRIPTLLATIGSVLLTVRLGALLFGTPAGLFAGVLLAVSVLETAEGRMATIDSCLLLAVMLCQTAIQRLWGDRDASSPTPARWAALFWASIGVGLMLKGPVMLIPGLGTPVALALVERRTDWWRRSRPGWGVPLVLAMVLPWCVAIWLVSHGMFFERAVGNNFLGKVASGQQAHGLPPGYHLLVFAVAFWPGSIFAVLAIPFVWAQRRAPAVRFLLCWIVPHWLVFELIATKLPHYVLPTYPAIAVLAAAALASPAGVGWPRPLWGRVLVGLYGLVWLTLGVVLCLAGPVLLWRLQGVVSVPAIVAAGLAMPLVLLSAFLLLQRRPQDALLAVSGGAAVAYFGIFLCVVPNLSAIWLSPRIAATVRAVRPCPTSVLASTSFSEPSLVFLAGQDTRLVNPDGAASFLAGDRSCGLALVGTRDRAAFDAALAREGIGVRRLARVEGINYSNGRHLVLDLFAVASATK